MGNFARAFLSKDEVKTGDRVRLRLINAATNRIFPMAISGVAGSIVAFDGMALPTPRDMTDLVLAPAQRADVIVDVTGPVGFNMLTRDGSYRLADLVVNGTNPDRRAGPIMALSQPAVPTPAEPTQHLTLTMMGGAMGGRHDGDNIWAFNNVSVANDTSFPHGIHLHGHHFYEVGENGDVGDLRDTTLVKAKESLDIICVFDNPGRWLLHCHMLSHAVGGMRTWVNVA